MSFSFELLKTDKDSAARVGRISTTHGIVDTPAFLPVGTQGSVKGLTSKDLKGIGTEMILCNTYHLYLRPGHELISELGGLHSFTGWNGPILTDSGGYQIYSLGKLRKIMENGVYFQSHLDGTKHLLTPEKAIEIQEALDADIIMCLDECTPYPATLEYTMKSMELTHTWARKCKDSKKANNNALFGIVQGGMFIDLRRKSAQEIVKIGFDGYAIGGLSVGEGKELMGEMLEATIPCLPQDRPRYLMGVGTPEDIMNGVRLGIDIFDCVLPTRNARNGTLFTSSGKLVIKNSRFTKDRRPIDERCSCFTCQNHSRAYIRHLYMAGEMLAARLNTVHNLHYYTDLMSEMRMAILEDRFVEFKRGFYKDKTAAV